MMSNETAYVRNLKDKDYLQLIEEREKLLEFIIDFEQKEMEGERSPFDWLTHPQLVGKYQVYLENLAELCILMKEKYHKDYIWGNRKLKEDAKK